VGGREGLAKAVRSWPGGRTDPPASESGGWVGSAEPALGEAAAVAPSATARERLSLRLIPADLLLVAALSLVAGGVVWADGSAVLRFVFGLPLLLFLPGYALASAFFPAAVGPDGVERVALGFALSLATIPFVGLIMDRTPWGVSVTAMVASEVVVAIAAAALATYRRLRLVGADAYRPPAALPVLLPWRRWDVATRATAVVIVAALALLVVGGAPIILARVGGVELTEFALYNAAGEPAFYPRELTLGETSEVQLGIVNREREAVTYTVTLSGAAAPVAPLAPVTLADGESWRAPFRFVATEEGERLPIRFELGRVGADGTSAYRRLELLVDVAAPGASHSAAAGG